MDEKKDREGRWMHTIEIDIEIEELERRDTLAIANPIPQ
jgi:hypothetical protein